MIINIKKYTKKELKQIFLFDKYVVHTWDIYKFSRHIIEDSKNHVGGIQIYMNIILNVYIILKCHNIINIWLF